VICKSSDGEACSSQGGWEQGWMVFQDANNSGLRESAEPVITHERALGAQLRMSGNLNVTRYISFTPAGSAVLTGGGFQAGTLTICNSSVDAAEARQIVLNAVGRARVQRKLVNSCI
jgi:type IV fimbrial biogenesis protein FimT